MNRAEWVPKKGSVTRTIEVAISWCQEPESGMLADIDRGSNPRSGFSLARGNGACAPWTLSRGRVAERRGDGVKHSTTPDDQGVTALQSTRQLPSFYTAGQQISAVVVG